MNDTNTEASLKALRDATAAASQLTRCEGAMREQHSDLLRERKDVFFAVASKGEIFAEIERLVDERAAKLESTYAVNFARQLGGRREATPGPREYRELKPQLPSFGESGSTLSFFDLCGLAPDLMKARLREIVETPGAVQFGLEKTVRAARIAELDAAIAELEERHSDMVAEAARVGLKLDLLPSVAKRRETEATAAERAARMAEDREKGFFPVGGPSVRG